MSSLCRVLKFGPSGRLPSGAIAICALFLGVGDAPAHAGVSLDVTPSFPAAVTAAATGISASFTFANSSTGPDADFSMSIIAVALTPSCGNAGSVCNQIDPGVFALGSTATGQTGTACAGATFAIAPPDANGKAVFSPSPAIVLTPTGQPGSSCTVTFTFSVLKVPTIDASNPTPGMQTDALAEVSGVTIGNPGATDSSGSVEVTVNRALPTLATTASAAVTLGGEVSDAAQLSAGSHPGGGNVTFHLYGPNDANCSLPQVFVSTNPANAAGAATSSSFTPTLPGTYRWIAAYGGDPDNLPVQAECNAANESVIVSLAPQAIAVAPGSLASDVPQGGAQTLPLDIENLGQIDLVWSIGEAATAQAPAPPRARETWVYDNGALVTHPGGGFGGADASVVDGERGLTLQGFGAQTTAENRLADDFIVPGPAAWTIDTLTCYAYQTGATTASALTDLRVQIWNGPPEAEGSRVVFGDRLSNRLLSSTFSHTYRVGAHELQSISRPILANVARIGVKLAPGTYWLEWSAEGPSGSGPWVPPAALAIGERPGNGLQASAGELFTPALDGAVQQEFPFRVTAHLAACDNPANLPWLSLGQTLGTTAGGATTVVDVTFDATGLAPGIYSGVLCVQSNDPDTPLVEVPVSLVVAVLFVDGFESGGTSAWSATVP
jgi:hypothetical protein